MSKQKRHIQLKKQYYKPVIIGLAVLIIGTYFLGFFLSQGKFLNNTYVNDINISKLSLEKTHEIMSDMINKHSVQLTFIDNEQEIVTKEQCGITYNKNNSLNQYYKEQNHWLWFMYLFQDTKYTLDDAVNIDQDVYDKSINQLKHLSKDAQKKPVNAKVIYKNKQFSIQKEDNGSTINKKALQKLIMNAFASKKTDVNVFDEKGYVMPKITSENKKLNNLLTSAKKYVNASITYKTTSGQVVLDGNDLIKWLSVDNNGQYYKDDEVFKTKAKKFVKDLAKKINNVGSTRTFTGATGTVTISGGNYGLTLNQSKEVTGLLKDIAEGKKGTRKPVTTGQQKSYENGGIGHTFVEVNLTKQKVYYVKNGKIAWTSDCVSGKQTDPERRTPTGTYYIYFKQRNRILRGTKLPNGKWPYETPVSYWMAFNGGIGLHDANYRKKFGGNIYINKGSHGCVNLPVSAAGQLYNMLDYYTPVIVHH